MTSPATRTALVTGASSGIGAATARALSIAGFHVFCVARRTDRITALAEAVGPSLDLLLNNAGGAVGTDHVAVSNPDDWRHMYEVNVIGTLLVTRALLPALVASGAGTLVNLGSTAGHITYEGGGGYTAAKHGVTAMTETLRLELNGQPVRVTEIAPGMVRTDEFSLNRFGGDQSRADAIYAGVREPLVAEDIADAIVWVATRPQHVNVDLMVLKPIAQAAAHKVHRE